MKGSFYIVPLSLLLTLFGREDLFASIISSLRSKDSIGFGKNLWQISYKCEMFYGKLVIRVNRCSCYNRRIFLHPERLHDYGLTSSSNKSSISEPMLFRETVYRKFPEQYHRRSCRLICLGGPLSCSVYLHLRRRVLRS